MEEEEKNENEGKELLPRVQRLEDELRGSKQNMIELIHGNRALQNELKAIQEEEGHIRQELASLRETLPPVLWSQVRGMEGLRYQKTIRSAICDPAFLPVGGGRQASSSHYSVLPHCLSCMLNLFVHVCHNAEYICACMHAVMCMHMHLHVWQLSLASTHCCQSLYMHIYQYKCPFLLCAEATTVTPHPPCPCKLLQPFEDSAGT